MKVKILENYKASEVLTEDAEVLDLTADSDAPVKEIADEIVTAAELGSDASVDKKDAIEAAAEAKAAANQIGADEVVAEPTNKQNEPATDKPVVYLKFENALTRALDTCAKAARKGIAKSDAAEKLGRKIPLNDHNLLVIGSPGCAKTAIVRDWAISRGMNLFSINLRENELYAFVNGYPCKETDENGKTVIKQAYSANLNALDTKQKNSVLFLDEFNRQTNDTIRQIVMEVVKEKAVAGDSQEAGQVGKRIFKDLLFTVAVMNPPDKSDKGLADLADAEKDRFPIFLKLKSNVTDTLNYVKSVTVNDLATDLALHKDGVNDPDLGDFSKEGVYANAVYASLLRWHLLDNILTDATFKFDDDYDYLADIEVEDENGYKHTIDMSNANDRAALSRMQQSAAAKDRKQRIEEIRGLVSQRTISNLFMDDNLFTNSGTFVFGESPLVDLVDAIESHGNITSTKQYMFGELIQSYIDQYNVGSGANSDIGPSLVEILADGGKELLELAGFNSEEIKKLTDYARTHKFGADNAADLEDVDADFEKDLEAAGDDLDKIAQIGVDRAKNAPSVNDTGFAAGNAQAAQSAAADIDWD